MALDGESLQPAPTTGGGVATSSGRSPLIPDFELIRMIGRGSYGDVWLARGLTGVFRAIKVVWRNRFSDAGPFEREFNGLTKFTAMSFSETGQLALLHVGRNVPDGFFYYVMELADDIDNGRSVDPSNYRPLTLREVRARGPLSAVESVKVGIELARALSGLHSRGLVHCDIKPSNVIMVGGIPKLADIGLVALTGEMHTFLGTEGYVPPEGSGTATADVYAFGKLLYELVTGLDREDYPRLPPDLAKRPDRPAVLELNELVLRACNPDLNRRYPDASALLADLVELREGHSLRLRRLRTGRWRLAVVVALLAMLAGAGSLWRTHAFSLGAMPPSESKQLLAKAWEQMDKTELGPENLQFADTFCKRASELDPSDAEVWAAWSQVNSLLVVNKYDQGVERREAGRADATRALKLAPNSYDARLAQACYLARLETAQFGLEAKRLLMELIGEKPNEPRALYAYAILQAKTGGFKQAKQALLQLTRNPQFAARSWFMLAKVADYVGDEVEFNACLDRSISIEPYGSNLSYKLKWYVTKQGDLDSAESLLATIPAYRRQSDDLLGDVFNLYCCERKPEKAISFLQGIPRDWFGGEGGRGPMGFLLGEAHELAGQKEMARIEWTKALNQTESQLLKDPSSRKQIAIRSRLLAFLGRFEEAEKSLKLGEQAGGYTDWYGIYMLRLAERRLDEAWDIFVNHIDGTNENYAVLKLDPRYDPLRNYPPFQAELAKAASDPKRMPEMP